MNEQDGRERTEGVIWVVCPVCGKTVHSVNVKYLLKVLTEYILTCYWIDDFICDKCRDIDGVIIEKTAKESRSGKLDDLWFIPAIMYDGEGRPRALRNDPVPIGDDSC